jgi:hypothetical protein
MMIRLKRRPVARIDRPGKGRFHPSGAEEWLPGHRAERQATEASAMRRSRVTAIHVDINFFSVLA